MRTIARDIAARTAPSMPVRIPPAAGSGACSGAGPADVSAPSMEVPLSVWRAVRGPCLPAGRTTLSSRCRRGSCASGAGAMLEDALRAALAATGLHPRRVAAEDPVPVRPAFDLAAGHELAERGG